MKLIKLSKLLCALSLSLGLINAVPIASETTSHQLILTTREDFANARRKAFLAFKNQWNPFTQIIKVIEFWRVVDSMIEYSSYSLIRFSLGRLCWIEWNSHLFQGQRGR